MRTSAGAAGPVFGVAVNGVAEGSALTSKEWLTSSTSGAYTTARTCAGASRLFEWTTHVERTASSVAAMLRESPPASSVSAAEVLAAVGTADALRPRLEATVGAAVGAYRERQDAAETGDGELKVTVLVTWSSGVEVSAHVAPLPPPATRPVRVEA